MKTPAISLALTIITLARVSHAQPIATVLCSAKQGVFALQYIAGSYEGQEQLPSFPATCILRSGAYRVKVRRSPYSEHACGAQPPVSVWITRGTTQLVSDAVFGDNCFGGPALVEFRTTEINGKLAAVRLCVDSGHPDHTNLCRDLGADQVHSLGTHPISQENLAE